MTRNRSGGTATSIARAASSPPAPSPVMRSSSPRAVSTAARSASSSSSAAVGSLSIGSVSIGSVWSGLTDPRLPGGIATIGAPMVLLAVQTDVLFRSLLIAVVLVSPYGVIKWRQVRALRAERLAREAAATEPDPGTAPRPPSLEDVIEEISRLEDPRPGTPTTPGGATGDPGSATLVVPAGITVGGDPASPALVDTLVRDALRRSGWVATSEMDTAQGRIIEVRRADPGRG